jgi:two-component system OmpR family response regulator
MGMVYNKCKILVVDDEKRIVEIVKAYLEKEGLQVSVAFDGKTALEIAAGQSLDLIILDLMLPEISGWDVCRALRKRSDVPVIMLTARDEVTDKIIGLELGADDYITKPFDPKELVSRVRAVLRRSSGKVTTKSQIMLADITIDIEKRLVFKQGEKIELTPMEFDLLKEMAEHPGRVYSRMQLLDKVQGDAFEGYERTIDSHIKNLRKKIEANPDKPVYVITIYGVGYKVEGGSNA